MNFNKIYKIEDLQALGPIDQIIKHLNQAMTPFEVPAHIATYKDLLPFVIRAKQIELYEPDSFFISKKHEYIYYLTEHADARQRKAKLGIKDDFYREAYKKEASKWYKRICVILKTSSVNHPIEDSVLTKAQHKLDALRDGFGYKFKDHDHAE